MMEAGEWLTSVKHWNNCNLWSLTRVSSLAFVTLRLRPSFVMISKQRVSTFMLRFIPYITYIIVVLSNEVWNVPLQGNFYPNERLNLPIFLFSSSFSASLYRGHKIVSARAHNNRPIEKNDCKITIEPFQRHSLTWTLPLKL
jgi:hypothetical protein